MRKSFQWGDLFGEIVRFCSFQWCNYNLLWMSFTYAFLLACVQWRHVPYFLEYVPGRLPCEQGPFDLPRLVFPTYLGRSKSLCSQGTGRLCRISAKSDGCLFEGGYLIEGTIITLRPIDFKIEGRADWTGKVYKFICPILRLDKTSLHQGLEKRLQYIT